MYSVEVRRGDDSIAECWPNQPDLGTARNLAWARLREYRKDYGGACDSRFAVVVLENGKELEREWTRADLSWLF